jgi:hypothetical protein
MDPAGNQTLSAHPGKTFVIIFIKNHTYLKILKFTLARFTPTDKHSKERIRIKERFGLLPTQKKAPIY